MHCMYKRIIICFLFCALCMPLFFHAEAEEYEWENQQLMLKINPDKLIFTIVDSRTGHAITSALEEVDPSVNEQWSNFLRSTVAIEYVAGDASTTTRTDLISGDAVWKVSYEVNGFIAEIDFKTCQIALQYRVSLAEDGIVMEVPASSVREYGDYLLCGVYLAPALGAVLRDNEPGYMLVPDGAGAIIAYSDGTAIVNSPYAKKVYGDNIGITEISTDRANYPTVREEEPIIAPVFGFTWTQKGLAVLSVMESGQDNAQIYAYVAGIVTPYNFVMSSFTMRDKYFKLNSSTRGSMVFETECQERDLRVRLFLLTDDQADYSGMAIRYRQYLQETAGLVQSDSAVSGVRLDFLGAETEKGMLWDSTVLVTNIEQMGQMLDRADQADIPGIHAYYLGWQPGGQTNGYGVSPSKLESSLGSMSQLIALAEHQRERNGDIALSVNLLNAYTGRSYGLESLARKINLQVLSIPTHSRAYPELYVLSPETAIEYAANLKSFAADEISIAVDGITKQVFSYALSSQKKYSRLDTTIQYQKLFSSLKKASLVKPIAEYWQYANSFLDMPLETTAYTILTDPVPFLTMALDGFFPLYSEYLNDNEDLNYVVLKLIEYETNPSWILTYADGSVLRATNSAHLYSTGFDYYLPQIQEVAHQLAQVRQDTQDSRIIHHAWVSDQVAELKLENGCTLYLNYSSVPQTIGNTVIPAMNWQLVGRDES